VVMIEEKEGRLQLTPFIDGWLQNNRAWGRPADLLTLPDGSLLISDDFANVIYRVTFNRAS
jgi:glucose/arabinose dehydrogenase